MHSACSRGYRALVAPYMTCSTQQRPRHRVSSPGEQASLRALRSLDRNEGRSLGLRRLGLRLLPLLEPRNSLLVLHGRTCTECGQEAGIRGRSLLPCYRDSHMCGETRTPHMTRVPYPFQALLATHVRWDRREQVVQL